MRLGWVYHSMRRRGDHGETLPVQRAWWILVVWWALAGSDKLWKTMKININVIQCFILSLYTSVELQYCRCGLQANCSINIKSTVLFVGDWCVTACWILLDLIIYLSIFYFHFHIFSWHRIEQQVLLYFLLLFRRTGNKVNIIAH